MKYTIEGFSQQFMVDNGLDCTDAVLLRYILDFYNSDQMAKISFNGVEYFWLKYDYVIEQVPIIGIKSKDGLYRRMKKYVDCGLLQHFTKRSGGTYSCYRFKSKALTQALGKPADSTDEKSEGYGRKVGGGTDEKSEQKIHLSNEINLSKDTCAPSVAPEQAPEVEELSQSKQETERANERFARFWDTYPKKKGKADARKKFDKALKKVDFAEMMNALNVQKASHDWTKDGGQYVPNPSTWLNQERWEDVVTTPPAQASQSIHDTPDELLTPQQIRKKYQF